MPDSSILDALKGIANRNEIYIFYGAIMKLPTFLLGSSFLQFPIFGNIFIYLKLI